MKNYKEELSKLNTGIEKANKLIDITNMQARLLIIELLREHNNEIIIPKDDLIFPNTLEGMFFDTLVGLRLENNTLYCYAFDLNEGVNCGYQYALNNPIECNTMFKSCNYIIILNLLEYYGIIK